MVWVLDWISLTGLYDSARFLYLLPHVHNATLSVPPSTPSTPLLRFLSFLLRLVSISLGNSMLLLTPASVF